MIENSTLTAVNGIWVGHSSLSSRPTGCSVILTPQGAVAGVDMRGAAPGTRETDLLSPVNTIEHVHAILLTGGSAFGLDAASGVMRWLEEKSYGVRVGPACVPIVPAAVIFDLNVGDHTIRPSAQHGYEACENASTQPVTQGNVGAGSGATIGKIFGPHLAMRGGLGSASLCVNGFTVAALVVCNALGDVINPINGQVMAGARKSKDILELLNIEQEQLKGQTSHALLAGTNTTIGVIATDAQLSKAQATRLAQISHDGLARSIRPVHTPMDGDTMFALATRQSKLTPDMMLLCTMTARVTQQAVVNAIAHAKGLRINDQWWPSLQDLIKA